MLLLLVFFLLFFCHAKDGKCGPIDWNKVAEFPFIADPTDPHWTRFPPAGYDVSQVAFRTYILAIVYLVLSSIWIITSLMLIGKRIQQRKPDKNDTHKKTMENLFDFVI